MINHILQSEDVKDCNVIIDIMTKGSCISNMEIIPKYITIHNTGNLNMDASTNHKHIKRCCEECAKRGHTQFIVDDTCIYQAQIANRKCFHTGTKIGNENSIGIEICGFKNKERQKKSYENAMRLIKILMEYYEIDVTNIVRHCDWRESPCPMWLNEGMHGFTWDWFIFQLNKLK